MSKDREIERLEREAVKEWSKLSDGPERYKERTERAREIGREIERLKRERDRSR